MIFKVAALLLVAALLCQADITASRFRQQHPVQTSNQFGSAHEVLPNSPPFLSGQNKPQEAPSVGANAPAAGANLQDRYGYEDEDEEDYYPHGHHHRGYYHHEPPRWEHHRGHHRW